MTGHEIKALRLEMRATQRKFAGLCGVSMRTVQNWEDGVPPSKTAMKVLESAATLFDFQHRLTKSK